MTEQDFQREDRDLDRDYAHRDARERHDAVSYAEIFGSAEIAEPVEIALAGWRRAMKIAAKAHDAIELGVNQEEAA